MTELTQQKIETLLFGYRQNLSRLARLKYQLEQAAAVSSMVTASFGPVPHSHCPSPRSPVSERTERVFEIEEKIAKLEKDTLPLKALMEDLKQDVIEGSQRWEMGCILELFYFAGNDAKQVMKKLSISRTTFRRRKDSLLSLAGEYIA